MTGAGAGGRAAGTGLAMWALPMLPRSFGTIVAPVQTDTDTALH
jgi:hypothetical protein